MVNSIDTSEQLRSMFLASITHEFRTPLSAMNASVEFLIDEYDHLSQAEVKELLKSIHLSVIGLQSLIENLLESINIEAGRFVVRPQPIYLGDVIHESLCVMKPLLDRRKQCVTVDGLSKIPRVNGDETHLTQALVNLLSNASKYGPMNAIIEVNLRHMTDNYICIEVADRGPGIPRAGREKIFQRFYRMDTHDGAQYGVGLGLSVVKAIVEEHGGEVGVEEREGGGSIFWFTLPVSGGAL